MPSTTRSAIFAAFFPACLLAGAPAAAQLLPPPPMRTVLYPDWSPPSAEAAEPVIGLDGQNTSPAADVDAVEQAKAEARRQLAEDSIVERDADGKVIRIQDPVDITSLRSNSAIQKALWPIIERELGNREKSMEQRVAARPDAAANIARGLIQEIDLNNPASLMELVQSTQPLNADDPIIRHLANVGALTEEQSDSTYRIMYEYQNAVFEEIEAELGDSGEEYAVEKAKSVYLLEESMKEAMLAFDRLNSAIFEHEELFMDKLEITDDQYERLGPWLIAMQRGRLAKDDGVMKDAWLKAVDQLETTQLINLYEKALAALEEQRSDG